MTLVVFFFFSISEGKAVKVSPGWIILWLNTEPAEEHVATTHGTQTPDLLTKKTGNEDYSSMSVTHRVTIGFHPNSISPCY